MNWDLRVRWWLALIRVLFGEFYLSTYRWLCRAGLYLGFFTDEYPKRAGLESPA